MISPPGTKKTWLCHWEPAYFSWCATNVLRRL